MVAPAGARAEKTRRSILDAAERLFAEHGFAATRLEDIATRVGIRRASMVYHFKDKRALHDAVLADVLSGLHEQIRDAVEAENLPESRIEAAVGAWVDYVAARPATARILLRELANSGRELPQQVRDAARPLAAFVRSAFVDDEAVRARVRESSPEKVSAAHVASTVAGATLFYVAAMPLIQMRSDFQVLDADQVALHKTELLRVVRQLLRFDPA